MDSKKELSDVRKEIDALDSELLELINKRAELAIEVSALKKKDLLGIYDRGRESEVEGKIAETNPGPLSDEDVLLIFREIISRCRSLQHQEKVAYLGPAGSFSNQAAFRKFGAASEFFPVNSLEDVFEEVHSQRADFGIVPVENSVEGSVGDVLDMLVRWDLDVSAECFERIEHFLLSIDGDASKIRTVASHPHALGQCRKWIASNLYGVALLETPSTTAAAKIAARDESVAAIASEFSGSIYNLKTIQSYIEDSPRNTTRFVVVGREKPPPSGEDKTSIAFSVKDEPGALHATFFLPFSESGINLTKIESRPSRDGQWEYVFFADFSGHREEEAVKEALDRVEANCVFLKVLGSYPAEVPG